MAICRGTMSIRRPGRRIRAHGAARGHAARVLFREARQIAILESSDCVKLSERTLTISTRCSNGCAACARKAMRFPTAKTHMNCEPSRAAMDAAGAPVAGVSLTIDAERMPLDAFVEQARPDVLRVAGELTRALRHSAGTIRVGTP